MATLYQGVFVILAMALLITVFVDDVSAREVCYDELGCFTNDGPFSGRSITLPSSPDSIKTSFMLFTRRSRTEYEHLDARYPNRVTRDWDHFQTNKQTKIIIHGFMAKVQSGSWMVNMMNELLDHSDYNVVIVDWSGGNGFIGVDYPKAVANTRVVGAQVAELIKTIVQKSDRQKARHFHIIGHSLGAHIAGYAGERIDGLGRISGLDPASPYFKNYGRLVRLDETDANFVDAIHTDIGSRGFGIRQAVGHADFYPNGGHSQPACREDQKRRSNMMDATSVDWLYNNHILDHENTREMVRGGSVDRFFTCNHKMAYLYFIESINSRCSFVSHEYDIEEHEYYHCDADQPCNEMGFYADDVKPGYLTKYYLETNSRSPYCG